MDLHKLLDTLGAPREAPPTKDGAPSPKVYSIPERIELLAQARDRAVEAEAQLRAAHKKTVADNTALRQKIQALGAEADWAGVDADAAGRMLATLRDFLRRYLAASKAGAGIPPGLAQEREAILLNGELAELASSWRKVTDLERLLIQAVVDTHLDLTKAAKDIVKGVLANPNV